MTTESRSLTSLKKNEELPKVKLELLSGPMDGLEFEIKKDTMIIGREQSNDVPIPSDGMSSRRHARITCESGEYYLEDLGSRNGTFIGENRVGGKVKLPLGVIFKVGVSEMRLGRSR